ncbi:MAG: type II toxin-antitoxin system RelE/ParE family toxin [Pseudomonadota bacterium]
MRLIVTPLAEADIEEIGDFIAIDNPGRAVSFAVELRGQCRKIAASPHTYRLRPELRSDIRSCVYGNYIIFFTHDEEAVRVLRVLHGARNIADLFNQRDEE